MEIIKNVATIVGCVISCISLLTILIRPLRKFVIDKITRWANTDGLNKEIQTQTEQIKKHNEEIKDGQESIKKIEKTVNQIADDISELSRRIYINEADRLRSILFHCGNHCRRGIPLSGEEFRHIQTVYHKYHDELHCNGIGEDEYNFIKEYFNSADNQANITQ